MGERPAPGDLEATRRTLADIAASRPEGLSHSQVSASHLAPQERQARGAGTSSRCATCLLRASVTWGQTQAGRHIPSSWRVIPVRAKDKEAVMPASMKIAVAGATGRVGSRVAELLKTGGHDVVPMSRSSGVDVVTGEGLAEALTGVECVIDVASGASPDQQSASEFFTASARNLHEIGQKAGVQRMVEVSIIGIDHFTAGYGAAKYAHEKAMLAGPIPVRVLRAAQFHEFVPQLIEWGTQGDERAVRLVLRRRR